MFTFLGPLPDSLTFWGWAAVAVLMASVIGFAAGVWHQRGCARREFRRSSETLSAVADLAVRRLQDAIDVCGLFETFPLTKLSDEAAGRLERQRIALSDSLARVMELRQEAKSAVAARRSASPFELTWIRDPIQTASSFPDETAFDTNLAAMLAACTRSDAVCGLLLVKADRIDKLEARFDTAGVDRLLQKLGGVICRAVRDDDLVCRLATDVFAALLPNVDEEEGARLAQAVRDSVRHYHFRLEESGPEILMTASFGYTPCHPAENADLVMNRAGDALANSQKRGRNQLHVHDGRRAVACVGG